LKRQPGKSLYTGRVSTACAVVNPLKKCLFVQRQYFVLFLKQLSPQLVDNSTCGTIPFPFPAPACKFYLLFFLPNLPKKKKKGKKRCGLLVFQSLQAIQYKTLF
jgi:hypothetical protein